MTLRILIASVICASTLAFSADVIRLPKPDLGNGTLAHALQERQTTRVFSDQPATTQVISNLLWAATGVNRPNGKRTVAVAMGRYAIELYALTAKGVFQYDVRRHALTRLSAKDCRNLADRRRNMGGNAAVSIILVADLDTFKQIPDENRLLFIGYEAGSICQDIYLYCANTGLKTVCCAGVNAPELAKLLSLPPNKKAIMSMIVGYPAAK